MPFSPSPALPVRRPHREPAGENCMAASAIVPSADRRPLKRALAPPNPFLPSKKCDFTHNHAHACPDPPPPPSPRGPPRPVPQRCPRSGRSRRPSMVQTGSQSFVSMPSFGMVFGDQAHSTGNHHLSERENTNANGCTVARPASSGNSNGAPYSSFHLHRDSRDSASTASSDNSPTTTISTMDSSSVTDPSPGPSPESPVAKAAPSSFVADFRSRRADNNSADSSPNTFFELQRPTTPAKRPRNLKNLGINTTNNLNNLKFNNTTAPLPVAVKKEKNSSAPPSPSFIKPPTPPKRRPSNLSLTISTPGSNETKPTRLVIPSTPSLNRPALRHFQSSPSLPLCSPSVAPAGGMQLPSQRPPRNPRSLSEVPFEMEEEEEEEQEPNFDVPQSREEKPAAYPNGPICIYSAGVYLYFEPTAEQAATFDVIVNVASEVKNPFTTPASISQKELDARRVDGPPAENVDFAMLAQRTKPASFDTQNSSPTTPKATPSLETTHPSEFIVNGTTHKTPEYIHMPWEHNTDIVPDLYKLVKTMDERVQQGKRVLVHCQCGVSRSASLIVAYGLYKNPTMSVQEAYDQVKKRSKWIGPNMNLIMQLQEFRNGLLRANDIRFHSQPFGRRSAGLPTGISTATNRQSPFEKDASLGSRTPRTAPLPPERDENHRASTGNIVSPGPLSAPTSCFFSDFRRSWAPGQTNFDLSPKSSPGATPYVDPKGHVVPILSVTDDDKTSSAPEANSNAEKAPTEQEATSKPPSVPNFSRQLPWRRQEDNVEDTVPQSPNTQTFLKATTQPLELEPLLSPSVSSFNIPSLAPDSSRCPKLSPMIPKFNINPWPPQDNINPPEADTPPAPTFTFNQTTLQPPPESKDQLSEDFNITSPVATQFPKDIFPPTSDPLEMEFTSPRASEFHMTPLKPRVADEDPFGLTSPTRSDFPSSPFETTPRNTEVDDRRPSFQAILPPSHLEQPEATNGFTSLNGTAQVQSPAQIMEPSPPSERPLPMEIPGRIDSLSTPPDPKVIVSIEPEADESGVTWSSSPSAPKRQFLSTPTKPSTIRTRFSSPNLREQRRLQKIQTEMESKLPSKAPHPPQAVDDLDALMSPRAEEFTRNPFHFNISSTTEDTSPASSVETIRDNQDRQDWTATHHWTPEKPTVDPRSPVQTGSSPIVRNIWDVL